MSIFLCVHFTHTHTHLQAKLGQSEYVGEADIQAGRGVGRASGIIFIAAFIFDQ